MRYPNGEAFHAEETQATETRRRPLAQEEQQHVVELHEIRGIPPLDSAVTKGMEHYVRLSTAGPIVMTLPENIPGETEDVEKKVARAALLDGQHIALTQQWKKERASASGTVQQIAPGEVVNQLEDAASSALISAFLPEDEYMLKLVKQYNMSMLRAIV
nr:hypothetical protein [Patescibacteria group bacterium]